MHGLSVVTATKVNSGVVGGIAFEAFTLPHQRPLQNDAALLVALAFLVGELVHPAQLAVAVLAADVPHHVSSCQHDAVLHLAVLQIHNLVEQESSSGGPSEARGDEFSSVGQNGVTVCTSEEASPANVIQEDPPHFVYLQRQLAGKQLARNGDLLSSRCL